MMIQMIKGVSMSEITDSIVDLFIEKENQVMGVADFIQLDWWYSFVSDSWLCLVMIYVLHKKHYDREQTCFWTNDSECTLCLKELSFLILHWVLCRASNY
jgi:hypothetical protein